MHRLRQFTIFLGDLALLYASLAITLLIRYGLFGTDLSFAGRWASHVLPFSIVFVLWIMVLYIFNLYQYKIDKSESLLQNIFLASFAASLTSIAAFYFFPTVFGLTPKTNIIIFGVVFAVLKYGWQHILIFNIFTRGRKRIIMVGNSPIIADTALYIKNNPHLGYSVQKWFDDPEKINFEHLSEAIQETGAHLIVIQDHLTKKGETSKLIYELLAHKVNIMNFWSFYEIVFDKVPIDELEEGWFIENISTHRPAYNTAKRIIEMILAVLVFIVFSPVMLLIAIAVKLTSKGGAIYTQKRMGKGEKSFTLYKFRTMREDAEGPLWTMDDDTRITPVGKILRATHLDELPQLVNVIKGDISIVGPRAERVELAKKYSRLPYYDMRHIVRPGITGWAQIHYRPSASVDEAKEKLCYDLYYIKNRSVFLDVLIVLKTARMFFGENK